MKPVVYIVAILAVLAGFSVWWLNQRLPSEVAICARIVPGFSQVGLGLKSQADGALEIDFGTVQKTENATLPEAYAAFNECLKAKNIKIEVVNGIEIPDPQPLGAIASHWADDSDLKLTLITTGGEDEQKLNNMRIGPQTGRKSDVLANWCGTATAGKCVECKPANPDETARAVEISLRPNAALKKIVMAGDWPNPPKEPWELIEDGKRFLYDCAEQ